jgi:hypothetical protein
VDRSALSQRQLRRIINDDVKSRLWFVFVPGQILHVVLPGVELCLVGKGGKVGLVGELVVVKVNTS